MVLSLLLMEKNDNKISKEVFSTLLYLSRLSLGEEEKNRLSGQVNSLIGYFEILDKFADNNLDSSMYEKHDEKALRSSEIKDGLEQRDLKKMTSEYMDNYFRVPKVLGSGA